VVVNNATMKGLDIDAAAGSSAYRPSLGKIFANAADVRLHVAREDDVSRSSDARTVRVDKGIKLAAGSACRARVASRGWEDSVVKKNVSL
jgi:hypothetical protein